MLRSNKLRVLDRLQANKSGKVNISEPHEGEGYLPVPKKKLFGFAQKWWVALAEAGGPGPRTPRPVTSLGELGVSMEHTAQPFSLQNTNWCQLTLDARVFQNTGMYLLTAINKSEMTALQISVGAIFIYRLGLLCD